MNTCYVYILASKTNRHLAIKSTTDLRHGVRQHRHRISQRLARKNVFQKVVLVETFAGLTGAVAREKEMLGWSTARVMHLVSRRNPTWKPISISAFLNRRQVS